jgi:hypothetical protein
MIDIKKTTFLKKIDRTPHSIRIYGDSYGTFKKSHTQFGNPPMSPEYPPTSPEYPPNHRSILRCQQGIPIFLEIPPKVATLTVKVAAKPTLTETMK